MMHLFYVGVALVLILFQTVVRPAIPLMESLYDPFLPVVVYFSLFRSPRESLPVVLCLGFVMDNLSTGPFGLYMTAYLWLFGGTSWLLRYLRLDNPMLLPLVMVGAVLFENGMILGAIGLLIPGVHFPKGALRAVAGQLVWVLTTGALVLTVLLQGHRRLERWYLERMAEKSDQKP